MNPRRNPLASRPMGGILDRPPPLDPGIGIRREADLASRLPDAELAGYSGPGVIPPAQARRGARPDAPPPSTARPLAGAAENNRGAARVVQVPAGTGSIPVGSVVETSRTSGDDAECIRVVCSSAFSDPNSGDALAVSGIVEFGIGGAFFAAQFDWMAGVSFSVPASFVRVGAVLDYATFGPRKVTLAAALGYGAGPSMHATPLRKTASYAIGGVTTEPIVIPPFASTLSVVTNQNAAPNLRVIFGGAAIVGGVPTFTTAVYEVTSRGNVAWQQDQFPVPGWATTASIENRDVGAVVATAVWGLSL